MKRHQVLILTLGITLGISYYFGYTPLVLAMVFVFASVIAYWLYAKDKAAAKTGAWRVPENTLHLSAIFFGWPGALFAQERLRHKTQKQSFRTLFWFTVVVNLAAVGWMHSPPGQNVLRQGVFHLENLAISHVPHQDSISTILFLTRFRAKEVEWPPM